MPDPSRCTECGRALSPDASPEGLCPRCLLFRGLETAETIGLEEPPSVDRQAIGGYRLLELLGEGGMGVVYLAEQRQPIVRRVALKLIKVGMDSREVIARFEAERQALALMNHRNVARVLDAGATEDGRPFFVMELVEGAPITEYCDRERLSFRERLKLFRGVCQGVQHAHHKGVAHRDLKPSNVLVAEEEGRPVAKIIDFGIAKAMDRPLTEKTLFTSVGQLVGTPEYMSPEQMDFTGADVDARTDVYSLGVLLYELLVGALPFDGEDLRGAGFLEMCRRIREDEPEKPSTRAGGTGLETAQRRRRDPRTLARELRGDLDWIVMRAMEKDRDRRYASPNELSEDIGRSLDHLPVRAGPPTLAYRVGKLVRRHRVVVSAAVLILGLMGIGLARYVVDLRRAEHATIGEWRAKENCRDRAFDQAFGTGWYLAGRLAPRFREDPGLLSEVGDALLERADGPLGWQETAGYLALGLFSDPAVFDLDAALVRTTWYPTKPHEPSDAGRSAELSAIAARVLVALAESGAAAEVAERTLDRGAVLEDAAAAARRALRLAGETPEAEPALETRRLLEAIETALREAAD